MPNRPWANTKPTVLNRTTLASRVSRETGIVRKQVLAVTNAMVDEVIASLMRGERVNLRGLGVFGVVHKKGRIHRQLPQLRPAWLDAYEEPDHMAIRFKPTLSLKKAVMRLPLEA